MHNILSIISPVMAQVENVYLKETLESCFSIQRVRLRQIEHTFNVLTATKQDTEVFREFFHSWNHTNTNVVSAEALNNRIARLVFENTPIQDEKSLSRTVASLDYIIDGTTQIEGETSDLYYRMATNICGNDEWMRRCHLLPEAQERRDQSEQNITNVEDIMKGLLTALIHSLYSLGEALYILPLFEEWLRKHYIWHPDKITDTLEWIKLHCSYTEQECFFHAVHAVERFAKAVDANLTDYNIAFLLDDYFKQKAAVMNALTARMAIGEAA